MNMPGFTAEASLYMRSRTYRGGVRASRVGAPAAVVAQQAPGCTTLCSHWEGCKTTCGNWPPGLSNYQCWLDCLAPTISCLESSVCYPGPSYPPPPVDCPEGEKCCERDEEGNCIDCIWHSYSCPPRPRRT